MRPLALVAGLLLATSLATTLTAQSRRDDQLEAPEVVDLELDGVKAVSEDELRESIATDESHCNGTIQLPLCWIHKSSLWYTREYLDRTELARDLLRIRVFYWRHGYRDARVDSAVAERGKDKVAVTFTIVEGEPTMLERVDVVGPDSILPRRPVARVEALAGKPFNLLRLD